MEEFKEISREELQSINGGWWPLAIKAAKVVGGFIATAVAAYAIDEAVEGIADGLSDECCECECN
jgi:lactobin A/cerein 7B family class IIb bacteriocin